MERRPATDPLRATIRRWIDVEAYRLGASLAFYALLSFVPLVVLGIALLELFLGDDAASRFQVLAWVDATGSPALRASVATALEGLIGADDGAAGIAVGVGGAWIAASGVFSELDTSLNRIFASEKPASSLRALAFELLRDRLSAFAAVVVTSLLVLVATVLGTAWTALEDTWFAPAWTTRALSAVATTVALGGALTLCIAWVPNVHVRWRSAALGGLGAAFALQIVRVPFGFAIVRFTEYPRYGVVGSVLVVLTWMWVAACILLLGACASATVEARPGRQRHRSPRPRRGRARTTPRRSWPRRRKRCYAEACRCAKTCTASSRA